LKSVSAAAGRMLGYAQSLLIGKPLLNFVALKYHQSTE